MSSPNGTCEMRNAQSGSEKKIDAGHVGEITSGTAETPLQITCPRRVAGAAAFTAKTSKIWLEITADTCAQAFAGK
jgi:acetylglutamate kinase